MGLHMAKGKYVCFLDADDYYLENTALERMIWTCEKQNVQVCGGLQKVRRGCGEIESDGLLRELCTGHPEGVEINFFDYQNDYNFTNYIFLLEIIKKYKICFPSYRRYEDPPFCLNVLLKAKRFWIIPVELYCYRQEHHNIKRHDHYILDTLMGIRDNMEIARQYQLDKLQKRLISRINNDLYWNIAHQLSKEMVAVLYDIENGIIDKKETLRPLNEMLKYHEYGVSLYMMRILLEMRYHNITIGGYLKQHQMINIAIYGLGTFGTILYNELQNSPVKIVFGIDKRKNVFENLKVVSDPKDAKNCDVIIVTPLREMNDIVQELKEEIEIPIYTLLEILSDIKQQYEKEQSRKEW